MYPQPEIILSKDLNLAAGWESMTEGERSDHVKHYVYVAPLQVDMLLGNNSMPFMECYITVAPGTLELGFNLRSRLDPFGRLFWCVVWRYTLFRSWWLSCFHATCQTKDHLIFLEDGETQCNEPHSLCSLDNEMNKTMWLCTFFVVMWMNTFIRCIVRLWVLQFEIIFQTSYLKSYCFAYLH